MMRVEEEIANPLGNQDFEADRPAQQTCSNEWKTIQMSDLLEWAVSTLVGSVAGTLFDGDGFLIFGIVVSFVYQFGMLPIIRPYFPIQMTFFEAFRGCRLKQIVSLTRRSKSVDFICK